MQISDRLNRARVSGTVRLSQAARDLRAAGHEVIDLGEGEPDFDTPAHIVDTAFRAAREGATRYTDVAGTSELRRAVARRFCELYGLNCQPEDIIVGTGAKQLIFNALLATLDPGEEVIIPAPHWVSYPDMVTIAEGRPVVAQCGPQTGYKLTADTLASLLTPKTRWLILNSPCNPTGAVYSAQELAQLASILRDHPQVAVMSDDIYREIVFDGAFATMARVAPDLADRVLTVDGVSKSYAMTGWRIGYAAGPANLIAAMTKLQGQSTTNASSVSQAAALAALEGPQDFLADWTAAYDRRRDLIMQQLEGVDGLVFTRPQGAFYHFIECSGLLGRTDPRGQRIVTDNDLSLYFLENAGVSLVPGSEFGLPGHLRLCFAKSDQQLMRACRTIREAVESLSG